MIANRALDRVGRKPLFESLNISSGSIEWLKWVALISMTIDHVNYFYLESSCQSMTNVGRLAFPLFVMLAGYNFAKHESVEQLFKKSYRKYLLFGLLALPAYSISKLSRTIDLSTWLDFPWYDQVLSLFPNNIMFSLLSLAVIIVAVERVLKTDLNNKSAIALVFLVDFLSTIGEYGLTTFLIGVGFYLVNKYQDHEKQFLGLCLFVTGFIWLCLIINESLYALIALPIFYIACEKTFNLKRIESFYYYSYYPFHVSLLVALKTFI